MAGLVVLSCAIAVVAVKVSAEAAARNVEVRSMGLGSLFLEGAGIRALTRVFKQ